MMGCATPTLAQINEEETVEVTNYQGKKEKAFEPTLPVLSPPPPLPSWYSPSIPW